MSESQPNLNAPPDGKATNTAVNVESLSAHMDTTVIEVARLPDPIKTGREEDVLLEGLLNRQIQLKKASEKSVVFSPALISRHDIGIIRRNTVNLIQGAYGSHKSRFAELLGALVLSINPDDRSQYLGFTRCQLEQFWLCYIDTERNYNEELPYAIQQMKIKAGYQIDTTPANFSFTSIKDVARKQRQKAVEIFLNHVRSETKAHLFVILDVVTDCVSSFNDDEQAMLLYDFIGRLCDHQNATFLLVIHQNAGSEKARGHTGSEGSNKSATVMQIGYEQSNGQDTDLIRLRFPKLRHAKRQAPIYLQYSDEDKQLVLVDEDVVKASVKTPANAPSLKRGKLPTADTMSTDDIESILKRAFMKAEYPIYNKLRENIIEASKYYGLPLAKTRAEEFIRRMEVDGYVTKSKPEGQQHAGYQLNQDKIPSF